MFSLNKALNILLVTNSLLLIAGAMLGPIYALFVEEIGGDLLDASIAGSIFALAAGIITIFSGNITDKVKEKELIVALGYVVVGLGYLAFVFTKNIYTLFIVQSVIGVGEAIYSPAFDAVYSSHISKNKAGIQWGSWESMYYFSSAFGALLGGIIVSYFGFQVLFYILAGLSFLSATIIYLTPRKIL